MKLCHFCHRLNMGQPQVCSYCGRSWGSRICQRGHVSPPDATFCGTCGSIELSAASPGLPLWLQLGFWVLAGATAICLLASHLSSFSHIALQLKNLAHYGFIMLISIGGLVLIFPPLIRKWIYLVALRLLGLCWMIIWSILTFLLGSRPVRRTSRRA